MSVVSIRPMPAASASTTLRMKHSNVGKPTPTSKSATMSKKIALPTMEGINFENTDDIVSLEAHGNYTMIHFIDNRQLLVCKSLNTMEQSLEGEPFLRVHRSATINLQRIKQYIKGKGGYVVMENNLAIAVSDGKKQEFIEALKEYFKF
jgi:two-component system, LytTR family, response regulator